MSEDVTLLHKPAAEVSAEALERAEEMIEREEGVQNKHTGWLAAFVATVAVVMSLFHLYTAYAIVRPEHLRSIHLAFVLFLSFLIFPVAKRFRHRVMWWDWLLALAGVATTVYLIAGGDDFFDRSIVPNDWDIVFGVALVLLILEAMRRTTGWILPFVTIVFPALRVLRRNPAGALDAQGLRDSAPRRPHVHDAGGHLRHRDQRFLDADHPVHHLRRLPAVLGRGQVLHRLLVRGDGRQADQRRAHRDAGLVPARRPFGLRAWRRPSRWARWRRRCSPRSATARTKPGGLLAAGGLGAIISPPVLGAAAFIIAEFLKISYLDVVLMATIPTCLFYLALFIMVEIDVRKFGMKDVLFEQVESAWSLTKKYWFHFLSLVSIVAFMLMGFSPELSVFWATVVALVTSFLHRDCALISYDVFQGKTSIWRGIAGSGLIKALDGGSRAVLNVAATCAGAGLIVGVVTLTGLGLKFSSIVLAYAGNSLLLTAIYTSLIVWIVGLAVPVTASYIICAVIAAPALIALKVPEYAAHMFIFYYAVLSEVSPPTALSPFAAAAITGGDPYKTTLQCWKYTAPAFLVPFMFVLDPSGTGLLLTGSIKTLGDADWGAIALVTFTAAIGIAALAGGLQGWLLKRTNLAERWMLIVAGFLLVYPKAMFDAIGFALVALVVLMQWLRRGEAPPGRPARRGA